MLCNCIASHCDVMSLSCLCAFVTLNKRLLTYLLTYLPAIVFSMLLFTVTVKVAALINDVINVDSLVLVNLVCHCSFLGD